MVAPEEDLASAYLSASAGSGKTYRLSMRFCKLLLSGVQPEAICALTFTRAATREIFAGVVERLLDPPPELHTFPLTPGEALSRLLESLPNLQISTIDAFAAKVARLFAYELGLNPDFTLYESDTSAEAQEVVRDLVRRALQVTSPRAAEALLRRFSLISEDLFSDSLSAQLERFFQTYGDLAERVPTGWGDPDRLTAPLPDAPVDTFPETVTAEVRTACADRLRAILTSPRMEPLNDKARAKLDRLLSLCDPSVTSVRELTARGLDSAARADLFKPLNSGAFTYGNGKKNVVVFTPEELEALRLFRDDLLARDFEQTAHHTQQLFAIVSVLNQAAEAQRRETGKISLAYIVKALSRTIGPNLSLVNPDLFYVTYRLDASVRHLMIDEFQDTSVDQWRALSNLASELAQEPDATFFYVGDVKQSIYGWRGGDATLFGDVTRVPDIPQGAPLLNSFRSSPAVIDLVNRLMAFTDFVNPDELEPWQALPLRDWAGLWQPHTAARHDDAFAAVLTLEGKNGAAHLDAAADLIAARWRKLKDRKLTLAVLAYRNKTFVGSESDPGLLPRLRARGVDCAVDGKRALEDAPMGRLLLLALRWLADPRDTLAAEVLIRLGLAEGRGAINRWLRRLHEDGFVALFTDLFAPDRPLTATLSGADREILTAAVHLLEGLDAQNCTDPVFAEKALRAHQIPCVSDSDVLRLMTVHHSKGLTFDVVFTYIDGAFSNEQQVLFESTPDWVFERPKLPELYAAYPQLAAAAVQRRASRFKDDLCALYVSVTRARREQQVLLTPTAEGSFAKRASLFAAAVRDLPPPPLPEQNGAVCNLLLGNAQWWESVPLRAPSVQLSPAADWHCERKTAPIEVELPSARAHTATLADFLAEGADDARLFGIEVHERLAAVGWSDSPPGGLFPEVFRKPDEPCELWQERSFSVKVSVSGALRYYAGQFDRVHLFPESRRAVIYDFKTSREPVATPAYCQQLRDYGRALTALTGYPPEAIRLVLLFTRSGKAVEVSRA